MILEGTVTNVTHFGAFVDIGVHQDGLVHISALSDKFVDDPRTVVKAGDIVKVKVMSVDLERARIALTMRLDDQPGAEAGGKPRRGGGRERQGQDQNQGKPARRSGATGQGAGQTQPASPVGALGAALLKAKKGKS